MLAKAMVVIVIHTSIKINKWYTLNLQNVVSQVYVIKKRCKNMLLEQYYNRHIKCVILISDYSVNFLSPLL